MKPNYVYVLLHLREVLGYYTDVMSAFYEVERRSGHYRRVRLEREEESDESSMQWRITSSPTKGGTRADDEIYHIKVEFLRTTT